MKIRLSAGALCIGCLTALVLTGHGKPTPEIKWDRADLGPFHTGTFKVKEQIVAKGIAIKVGDGAEQAAILFDPELIRMSAAWTGGFIIFPRGRGGLEGQIVPDGSIKFSTAYAPGWSKAEIGDDPRQKHQGHLPAESARWNGLFLNGNKVILRYTVANVPVLEIPGYEKRENVGVFTRTLQVGKTGEPLTLLVADLPGGIGNVSGSVARLISKNPSQLDADTMTVAAVINGPNDAKLQIGANGRVTLRIPPLPGGALFQVCVATAPATALANTAAIQKAAPLLNPSSLLKGGPARWGAPLETQGKPGQGDDAYVADEITLPDENLSKSWLRPGGHDFFPDGTAAVVNLSGDVWLVTGLDETLTHVKWKRFATGLFQPLGCKVVDGKIYVLGRDQITRLHDLNNDGEADFYENFNNDCVVTDNYHEFALDLQTDSKGNFFYAKASPWTPTNTSPHQGCLIRVSRDGSKSEVFATGLRAPNGVGIGPRDEITVSDNQGHWTPANRLNLVRRDGFYGMTPAAHRVLTFKTVNGSEFQANPSDESARAEFKTEFWGKATDPVPTTHDLPLCWVPMQIDNSSGGQVWIPPGNKWGPLGGHMLFLSYGKCALFQVLPETVDGQAQGGLSRFPLKFSSGIMRARFNPKDNQLYLSGLNVWQSSAVKDGCFYRVRYSGKPVALPVELHALKEGMQIKFNEPLDAKSATDGQNFSVERWNYAWTGEYGSPDISIINPNKRGRDLVLIDKLLLSPDRRSLLIVLPEMQPVMQMKLKFKINDAQGRVIDQEIYHTIHRLPETPTAVH